MRRKKVYYEIPIVDKWEFRSQFKRDTKEKINNLINFFYNNSKEYLKYIYELSISCELQSIYPQEFFNKEFDCISKIDYYIQLFEEENIKEIEKDIRFSLREHSKFFNYPQAIFNRFPKQICYHILNKDLDLFNTLIYKDYMEDLYTTEFK